MREAQSYGPADRSDPRLVNAQIVERIDHLADAIY
jgi:hypothetical protein